MTLGIAGRKERSRVSIETAGNFPHLRSMADFQLRAGLLERSRLRYGNGRDGYYWGPYPDWAQVEADWIAGAHDLLAQHNRMIAKKSPMWKRLQRNNRKRFRRMVKWNRIAEDERRFQERERKP